MLEVSLRGVSLDRALHDITLTFPASTHTAIVGPPASGASTLLEIIAGRRRPSSGEIRIGARVVNDLKASRRPLLAVGSRPDVPGRWSVQHALVAAARQRTLDRIDRQHEYELAVDKWRLRDRLERRVDSLSDSERTLLHLARIELLRPAILLADRLFEKLNTAALEEIADTFYRTLRVAGTTIISAPASRIELGSTDHIVVLDGGRVVQEGTAAQVYARPVHEAAAVATGDVNLVPVTIRGSSVDSVIGSWDVPGAPFQGSGVAFVRPEAFSIVEPGEESDLIAGVEEAAFQNGRWLVRSILSGGFILRISLPPDVVLHKGKLLALAYDPAAFSLTPRDIEMPRRSVPTDVVPPLAESR
ncbi:MAG TPA: ATP-binding cassette domain-containing protein [Thermoanaerobaculia bacterium]|nr:ATP-binding cassette domain-containing protein [Thermoanaerobaculia bacterium]